MAAPNEKTIEHLSGRWTLERKLSTGMDEVMSLQGLSWMKIKACPGGCEMFEADQNADDGLLSGAVDDFRDRVLQPVR